MLPSVHDDCTRVSFINDKQAFRYTNNMVSDYFHLKTNLLLKRQKVVRLLPHLSHRLLRLCFRVCIVVCKQLQFFYLNFPITEVCMYLPAFKNI